MDKDYLVTKSNYFIMNCNYDLSLQEQKLILTLASMVQPNDEEFKPYLFKISEFMKLLGVEDKSKYTEIPKITKELIKKVFEIQEGKTLIQTAWLSSARYEKGSGAVTLKFSPDLKPYMLKLNSMFTQYKLANILSMKSKYSPRIYEILKCNEFKKQGFIEIEIEELRKLIKAENVYPLYANFKQKLLIVTQNELKEKTDISFEFEEIKTGRKVTSLKFYIHSNKTNKTNKTKIIDQVSQEICATTTNSAEISVNEIVQMMSDKHITPLIARKIYDSSKGNIDVIYKVYNYFKDKKADNFIGLIINQVQPGIFNDDKKNYKKSSFSNIPERNYDGKDGRMDFREIEARLLGTWGDLEEADGVEYKQGTLLGPT